MVLFSNIKIMEILDKINKAELCFKKKRLEIKHIKAALNDSEKEIYAIEMQLQALYKSKNKMSRFFDKQFKTSKL